MDYCAGINSCAGRGIFSVLAQAAGLAGPSSRGYSDQKTRTDRVFPDRDFDFGEFDFEFDFLADEEVLT